MTSGLAVALLFVVAHGFEARQQTAVPSADLLLTNARVVSVDDGVPQAEAVAVRGDRIVALGSSAELRRYAGPATRVIDLQGQVVIPGFFESHGHFSGVGEAQLQLNLTEATSWSQIVALVATAAKTARPGEWIVGRGWHQEKWTAPPDPAVEGVSPHPALRPALA